MGDVPRRHDGRNRVLINKLLRGAAEDDAVLIERLDLPEQPDSIGQINRDGNAGLNDGF